MHAVADRMEAAAAQIRSLGRELLLTHSGLSRDWEVNNPESCPYIVSGSDHQWNSLSVPGQQVQSRLRDDFKRFVDVLRVLMRSQSSDVLATIDENCETARSIIDQEGPTWLTTTHEAIKKSDAAVDALVGSVARLYDASEGDDIYVPDTNALLYNPQLDEWSFDDSRRFTIALIPTVLSELDRLKVTHRNESLRQKAEGLIGRIKEYRRRGALAEGVPLRANRSRLKTVAIEPTMSESLPWLDRSNNDDRLLAGFVEVMRQHPRCAVVLVTRDINLQNKANYARLLFVEPPEPPGVEKSDPA